jgi:uncharacterized protein YecE (DUF72 family)
MGMIRVGCSGWSYPHWRQPFYGGAPASAWLARYAQVFDTVEVNATFYRLPRRSAVEHWVAQTPPGFRFAVKASRYLTHVRRLRDIGPGARLLLTRLAPLAESGRLGPLLWQLPETLVRDVSLLEDALAVLPPGLHAFEFRHPSWFCDEILDELRRHGAALVIADHPERGFQTREITSDIVYVRLHYGREGGDGCYATTELVTWAERIVHWAERAAAYVYFNNDWNAFAPANALALRGLAGARESRAEPERP